MFGSCHAGIARDLPFRTILPGRDRYPRFLWIRVLARGGATPWFPESRGVRRLCRIFRQHAITI
jgi:hypothetical protein